MNNSKQRRHFEGADKVAILKRHLIDKVPISDDIFTEQFMTDVGATSINDMLSTYGAGVGTVLANPASDAPRNARREMGGMGDSLWSASTGIEQGGSRQCGVVILLVLSRFGKQEMKSADTRPNIYSIRLLRFLTTLTAAEPKGALPPCFHERPGRARGR